MMIRMNFEILKRNGASRIGRLKTKHGTVMTPIFFPVFYTGANFGWSTPHYWKTFSEINTVMFNASHIMMHSQKKLSTLLNQGIHRRLGFRGVSFIDSGGWVYKRLNLSFSQKEVLRLQENIGADIGSTLDYPINVMHSDGSDNIAKSVKNAIVASRAKRSDNMQLFASIHGYDPVIVRNVIQHLRNKGNFDGFAIGSLMPSFYNFELLVDIIATARREVPDTPLHVYGLAGPVLTELLAYLGIDTMDSSFFMRAAANREYATPTHLGRIPAKKISELKEWTCTCKICKRHDVSEIARSRHLLSQHNLWVAWSQIKEFKLSLIENRVEERIQMRFKKRTWARKAFEYARHRSRFGSRSY
jgi:7-cyano-7-deazaguanine tRNA-ribosyltransferase